MGFLSNLAGAGPAPPPPLQPVPQPIGVIPYFTQHKGQIALKVRERKMSLSGDDFSVKDAYTGQTMFQVDGSTFSFRQNKCESTGSSIPCRYLADRPVLRSSQPSRMPEAKPSLLFNINSSPSTRLIKVSTLHPARSCSPSSRPLALGPSSRRRSKTSLGMDKSMNWFSVEICWTEVPRSRRRTECL